MGIWERDEGIRTAVEAGLGELAAEVRAGRHPAELAGAVGIAHQHLAGAQAAEETAARMEELGLVDDEAYARRLARDLLARKHYPRRRLAQELTGKGIDRALAEEAAAEAMEEAETDDGQQALELLRKKYYNRLYDENARRKTAAALARYGFGGDAVRRAMEAALSDQEDNGN